MTVAQLVVDPEFTKRWPYVWSRLEPYFLARQRKYAMDHPGEHEEIGQFVEFTAEVMKDLESISGMAEAESHKTPPRKKLHRIL